MAMHTLHKSLLSFIPHHYQHSATLVSYALHIKSAKTQESTMGSVSLTGGHNKDVSFMRPCVDI